MSEPVATVRASAERRTDFEKQIDDQIAMHVLADAIVPKRAARLAVDVIFAAIIQENNRQTLGEKVIDADGKQRRLWDQLGAIEQVIVKVKRLSSACRYISYAVGDIVSICFAASRNWSFLDTDEIPMFVGVAYGVGIVVQRELPDTAHEWVNGRAEQ